MISQYFLLIDDFYVPLNKEKKLNYASFCIFCIFFISQYLFIFLTKLWIFLDLCSRLLIRRRFGRSPSPITDLTLILMSLPFITLPLPLLTTLLLPLLTTPLLPLPTTPPNPLTTPAPYKPEPHYEEPKNYEYGYDVHEYDAYGNPNVHSKTEVRDGYQVKGN